MLALILYFYVVMRNKWFLPIALSWFLLFLSGCFDSLYDYTSDFEKVGERSESGSERDSSLRDCSLSGQFDFPSNLVPVKVEVIAIDEDFKEKKSLAGKITEESGVYRFSVPEYSYPTSLVKVHYTCKAKDSTQNFEMKFSQYASIADDHNLLVSLGSAIKGRRIEFLMEDDVFSFDGADLKATQELYHILRLDSETKDLKSSDSSIHKSVKRHVEIMSYIYLGGKLDSTFKKRFDLLSSALDNEKSWWESVSEVEVADAAVQNFKDRNIPLNSAIGVFADFWSGAYKLSVCDSSTFSDTIKNPEKTSVHFDDVFVCNKGSLENAFYYWHPLNEMEKEIGLCQLSYQCYKKLLLSGKSSNINTIC